MKNEKLVDLSGRGDMEFYAFTTDYLLAGTARNGQWNGRNVTLEVGPYVIYRFRTKNAMPEYIESPAPLVVDGGVRTTRRQRTHERHIGLLVDAGLLEDDSLLEEYRRLVRSNVRERFRDKEDCK